MKMSSRKLRRVAGMRPEVVERLAKHRILSCKVFLLFFLQGIPSNVEEHNSQEREAVEEYNARLILQKISDMLCVPYFTFTVPQALGG